MSAQFQYQSRPSVSSVSVQGQQPSSRCDLAHSGYHCAIIYDHMSSLSRLADALPCTERASCLKSSSGTARQHLSQ